MVNREAVAETKAADSRGPVGGIAGWLMARFSRRRHVKARLALLERIALGPHQSLALVEAEGRRLLVATSAEGGPAFYPLDELPANAERTARIGRGGPAGVQSRRPLKCASPRISW